MDATTVPQEVTRLATPDFDEWVAARGPSLLRLARVLSGNAAEAEDVVQEALSRPGHAGRGSRR